MKRGPLSQKDKEYLEKNKDKDALSLSKKLKRNEDSIQKYLDELKTEPAIESIIEPPKETILSSNLTRNKKYGAVIMTENASMISDEIRKKKILKGTPISGRYKNAIHIKSLDILWCATLNDGTLVYSDYERPDNPRSPWLRLREHCQDNNVFITKIEVIMFGAQRTVMLEDENGLDGVFIVRGASRDLNLFTDEPGPSYKQLVVGLLRENEDVIDVKKFCWPENELEKLNQTRVLTPENAKLMLFKNGSTKKQKETVQIALNGATV